MLSLCAVAGPVLFTAAWIGLGIARPRYSWIADQISALGVGEHASTMNLAFVLCGILTIAGVVGFCSILAVDDRRWNVPAAGLLVLSGAGVALDGTFTYMHFMPHVAGFLMGAGLPIIAFPMLGSRFRSIGWGLYVKSWLLMSGPILLILLFWYFRSFDYLRAPGEGIAGFTERLLILVLHGTFALLGIWGFTKSRYSVACV
jgi:hypothetical protein